MEDFEKIKNSMESSNTTDSDNKKHTRLLDALKNPEKHEDSPARVRARMAYEKYFRGSQNKSLPVEEEKGKRR